MEWIVLILVLHPIPVCGDPEKHMQGGDVISSVWCILLRGFSHTVSPLSPRLVLDGQGR